MLFLISMPSFPLLSGTTIVCWKNVSRTHIVSILLVATISLNNDPLQLCIRRYRIMLPLAQLKASTRAIASSKKLTDDPNQLMPTALHSNNINNMTDELQLPALPMLCKKSVRTVMLSIHHSRHLNKSPLGPSELSAGKHRIRQVRDMLFKVKVIWQISVVPLCLKQLLFPSNNNLL